MKRVLTTTMVAAVMAFTAMAPVTSTPAEARNRGAKVAAGVILGVAALAIIANSSSSARASGNRESFAHKCHRWYNECTNGRNSSCEKFETRGCTE